ncbi:pentapeptide repeat-containing protein [Micromonospora rubida]|uniref:pentapeptide repeat-containing protein n=1 Tax=Micromonospora rubida TaxID=2697657 RepID=UPI0013788E36|nr:pentapeptide repeat-containing protein [Micromonospora rubida]NBE79583.1 hypothetical protein [Micromonospora rubida]
MGAERTARRGDAKEAKGRHSYRPLRPATLVATSLVLVLLAAAAGFWMWKSYLSLPVPQAGTLTPAQEADFSVRRVQLQLDAIRNALGVAAGLGAVVALLLALRRQYVKERVDGEDLQVKSRSADIAETDATEKRLTELYVKAAEQLGSEKAPIRMAGIYALERLADGYPQQRQTIVDLLCSYLRMPFEADTADPGNSWLESEMPEHRERREAASREREVRLTVQSVLRRHLCAKELGQSDGAIGLGKPISDAPMVYKWWGSLTLNLAGAYLINLDLSGSRVGAAVFDGTVFSGRTSFAESVCEHLSFVDSTFVDEVDFSFAMLEVANFANTNFVGPAVLSDMQCHFLDAAGAVFHSAGSFDRASFLIGADFGRAVFFDEALFRQAQFVDGMNFEGCRFSGDAYFTSCSFGQAVRFRQVTIMGHLALDGSLAPRLPLDRHWLPGGWELDNDNTDAVGVLVPVSVAALGEPEDFPARPYTVPASEVGCCVPSSRYMDY